MLAALGGALLFPVPRLVLAVDCTVPVAINPVPALRAHVDFPVEYQATLNRYCGSQGASYLWEKTAGPPEFDIDGAGGRFYWTPTQTGTPNITIKVNEFWPAAPTQTDTETFTPTVDDNTMTQPLFRDYRSEATTVDIRGRAHGTDFVSYTLQYAHAADPGVKFPIAGPLTTPVVTTGTLAPWDISSLPDGGRYLLTLTVNLVGGETSVLNNPVIIDRSAKPGWPIREDNAITHSVVLADLDNDGVQEVIAALHSGKLYVWQISGEERFPELQGMGPGYSAPSVGDINKDGVPEIIWATAWNLYAVRPDGSIMPGFPVPRPSTNLEFRATPTLADLDGDGVLDIILPARGASTATNGEVYVYRYNTSSSSVQGLAGWPQSVANFSLGASASVADLDGDGGLEVVAEAYDRVYAWHANGTPLATGLHMASLPIPIANASTNGVSNVSSTAQPAIADLDGDGVPEIIIASNVLQVNGTVVPGWAGGKPLAQNSLSAAIGDIDGNLSNGLEVVLGNYAWHANGTDARAALPGFLSPVVLGDLGNSLVDTIASSRNDFSTPGVRAFTPTGAGIAGYPKSLYGETLDLGAPVVGDFDGDGLVDVAVGITDSVYGTVVAIWEETGTNHPENQHWPMMGHDVRHTGAIGCTSNAMCNDGKPCTSDSCTILGQCVHTCQVGIACGAACGVTFHCALSQGSCVCQ